MKKINLSLLFAAIASSVCTAKADDFEHIVVSGTRTPKLLANSPVLVDVLDGDTINMLTKGTLAQALEFIPGVVITRSPKDGYNVQMQGFDSKHVLILIDGQPLISPTGSSADLDQVSASDIAQIEVLKGAASVLYGSAAMGGVINIITKKELGDQLSISYEAGSYLDNAVKGGDKISHLAKINAATKWHKWQHKANIQIIEDSGFDYDSETVSQNAAELSKLFVNLSSFGQIKGLNAGVKYQYFDELKERPTSSIPGQTGFIHYKSDVKQHQFDLLLDNKADFWKVNARYISHTENSGQSNSLRDTEIELAEIDGQKVWQIGDISPKRENDSGSEIVAGFVAHFDSLDQIKPASNSVEIDNETRHSIESYAQYNFITPDHQVLVGVRGQDDSDFGFQSALRISGMLDFSQQDYSLQLRGGYGQGYRVPDLKERYYIFDHSNLGYMVLGDENLTPEEADNFTASLSFTSQAFGNSANISLEVSAHYSETDDLITSILDPDESELTGLSIYRYTNLEKADIYGFNLSSELTFDHWMFQANYSYVDSEDQDGIRLEDRPRHQVKVNFGYDFTEHDIETLLSLPYQADEAVPDGFAGEETATYTIVNFKLNHYIDQHIQWHLALNNIFDEHLSPDAAQQGLFDPRPTHSQEVRIGLKYTF